MRKMIWLVCGIIVTVLILNRSAFALHVDTHKAINLSVAKSSSVLSDRLQKIGFSNGVQEYFNGYTVEQWFEQGGLLEDIPDWCVPYIRSLNHFHNPITNAGLGGNNSAVRWASMPANGQNTCGNYSWADARQYYLQALTYPTKTARDNSFAQTFRGVGQLMHLVQDMSVPEHTRMDVHLWPYADYENYVVGAGVNVAPKHFTGFMPSISVLFDTNIYNGTNPEVTNSTSIGLSEFTNANFLSDDTIFTGFTYPRIEDTELWTDSANNRNYLRKPAITAAGVSTGVGVEHLAASSWIYFYRLRYFPQDKKYIPVALDDTVYADYAAQLLPRAVGYSANLLSHFFRGKIDMVEDTENPGTYKITNNSTGESMNGTFNLYYDDTNDNRNLVDGVDLSAVNGVTLAFNESASIPSFSEPSDIKEPGKYMLVFSGTLGQESGRSWSVCKPQTRHLGRL